jgi:DNA-binding transcriptional ArsR family regulator
MKGKVPACKPGDHGHTPAKASSPAALNRAAALFKAMGDAPRLRLLELLMDGERCVTELVDAMGEHFSTVSQRLRVLRGERLVTRRREGTHVFYALADRHVVDLLANALDHAAEKHSETISQEENDE